MASYYRKNFRGYRGRPRGGSLALKIVIALLALILAACIIFVAVLGGRVEYTDDGVRLVLPWRETATDPAPDLPSPTVVIDGGEDGEEEETPSVQPEETFLRAVEVTGEQLTDGSAAALVAEAGGNALVVEMKNGYGRLSWNSDSETALTLGANRGSDDMENAVKALAQDPELWLVARVSCFRDLRMASAGMGGPLMTRGGNMWYDPTGLRWVSPVSEPVRSYLSQLCMELADMGFDEILLDCAGYPYAGEVHVLATDTLRPADRSVPVETFLLGVREALSGSDVALSVLLAEAELPGEEVYSGITAQVAAACADRVWITGAVNAEDCISLLSAAGMADAGARVVQVGEKNDNHWAMMKDTYGE